MNLRVSLIEGAPVAHTEAGAGLAGLVAEAEAAIVAALGLHALALPPGLARAEAPYKEATARLEARAYRGGPLGYARFITLTAGPQLAIGNALCLGRPALGLPILGADVVQTGGGRPPLLVADLSPTLDEAPPAGDRDVADAGDEALRAAAAALPPAGPLPPFCARFFSPAALFARVPPEAAPAARAGFTALVARFIDRATAARPDERRAAAAAARSRAYLEAHREEDPGLGLLDKIFGAAFARAFVAEVMFPARQVGDEARDVG